MKNCKFCGSEEFYVKEKVTATIEFYYRFDGVEADNSSMHDGLKYKRHKKAYCNECEKCLGDADELIESTQR